MKQSNGMYGPHPPKLVDVIPVDHISTLSRRRPLQSNWLESVQTVAWSFILRYEDDQIWDCEIGHHDAQFRSMGNGPAIKRFLHEAARVIALEDDLYEFRFLKSIPPFPMALRMIGPRPRVIVSDFKGNFTRMPEEEYVKEMIRLDIERINILSQLPDGDSIGGNR